MKGLLIKDIKVLRQQGLAYLAILALWLFISIMDKSTMFFSSFTAMFVVIIPITLIGYDEKAKWDKYALAMPVKRSFLALSKYIMAFVAAAVCFVITGALGIAMTGNVIESLLVSGGCALAGLVIVSVMLPLMFKFGVEKGRIVTMLCAAVPFGVVFVYNQFGASALTGLLSGKLFLGIIVLAGVLIICSSVWISVRIYNHKEFN